MKTIVIYKSKTGFTKRYAEWIAKDLGCEALSADKVSAKELQQYQTIIYGGGIMAGQIGGLKKLKGVIAGNPDKKLIVFATGATPAEALKEKDTIKEANFTTEESKNIPYFYFQSGINYEDMKLGAKLLMKMFAAMLGKKKSKTAEEQGMVETITKSADYSDIKFIQSIFFLSDLGSVTQFLKNLYEDFVKYTFLSSEQVDAGLEPTRISRIQGIRSYFQNYLLQNIDLVSDFDVI